MGIYENDIATLLYYYRPDLERLLKVLSAHLNASDLEEVRSIVGEIQRRTDRFKSGPPA